MNPDVSLEATVPRREAVHVAPIAQRARIADIDVLRGIALFGVLMMNLMDCFRVPWEGNAPETTGVDHIVSCIHMMVLSGKAMTTFSMLFGAGLAIFLERASARMGESSAMKLLLRRLVVLLCFGLAHLLLVWNGDILVEYALIGMIALLFIRKSNKALLVMIAICLALPPLSVSWPALRAFLNPPKAADHYQQALRVYATGSYADIVHFRTFDVFLKYMWHQYPFWGMNALKNMLIGMLVWRSGILRAPQNHLRLLRWAAAIGIALGAIFPAYRTVIIELYHPPHTPASPLRTFFYLTSIGLLALGYCAGILLLLRRERWRRWLGFFGPLGRMAFTNYLTESIVFSTLFYGYGFGLIGKFGEATTTPIGIAFYILQGVFSAVWLRHFKFGPFEWVWRSLTYGQLQPFRRGATQGATE